LTSDLELSIKAIRREEDLSKKKEIIMKGKVTYFSPQGIQLTPTLNNVNEVKESIKDQNNHERRRKMN
jgi:hypothetical protein